MNEQDRKFLTEDVLGECWHKFEPRSKWSLHHDCIKCDAYFYRVKDTGESLSEITEKDMRTFATPQDAYDLEQALVKNTEWINFEIWLFQTKRQHLDHYLFRCDAEQRCQLIADFLKEVER